jgi:hypothetical protein
MNYISTKFSKYLSTCKVNLVVLKKLIVTFYSLSSEVSVGDFVLIKYVLSHRHLFQIEESSNIYI